MLPVRKEIFSGQRYDRTGVITSTFEEKKFSYPELQLNAYYNYVIKVIEIIFDEDRSKNPLDCQNILFYSEGTVLP
jgi:hypothetical protein